MATTSNCTIVDGIKCYAPEVSSQYDDYPAEGIEITSEIEERSFWVRSRARILKWLLLKQIQGREETSFLEIGCGSGYFLSHLVNEPGLHLTGSEVYAKWLASAKSKLPAVELIQLDAASMPFLEEFDAIGAFDVIEHIENDSAVLHSMAKSLKPGGLVIITVPQYQFLWGHLDEVVKHKRRYSKTDLVSKLRAAGFEIAFVSSFFFTLFPLMFCQRMIERLRSGGSRTDSNESLARMVSFPDWLNQVFDTATRLDEALIHVGVSLPFGGSLIAIARKA